MGQIDNLNQGQLAALIARIEKLERGTPTNNAAIGRSGLLVYGGGVITIENGGLYVTGTAEIVGRLIASGIIDFTGDVTISGPLDVTGLMTLAGDLVVASGGKITAGTIELNPDGSAKFGTMTISPAGKITTGSAEISPDGSAKFGSTNIDTAGKVKVGTAMTLDPTVSSGALVFSNGAQVFTDATTIQVYKGTSAVQVANGTATLLGDGSNYVRADGSGIRANGPLRATSTVAVDVMNTAPAGKTANVYWDSVDHVFKVVV